MKTSAISESKTDRMFSIGIFIVSALILLIIIYPLFFVCIASISNPAAVANGQVFFLPKDITFAGYKGIFKDQSIWTGYRNTLFYSFVGTAISLIVTLPTAYALSRKDFKPRGVLSAFFVFTMFFTGGLIPTYLTIKQFHMDNTIWAMLIPFSINVFNLIIARSFFQNSIPESLQEAAKLDGCNDFKFFMLIVLPLSKALLTVIGLYYLIGQWNSYFNAMIYLRNENLYPLQLILRRILIANQTMSSGGFSISIGEDNSAAERADLIKYGVIVVSSLPVIVLYPFVQKYFEKGVMIGSVKG
jgi:putative aldouronate transport system permease protein